MSTGTAPAGGLAPVAEDLSAYVVSGQVVSKPRESKYETAYRTAAQGVEDGVEAERIGFRRVFLSERWNLKEFGAFLGGIAARTSRIEVATGLVSPGTRHPQLMAATGATLHACYGPRFVLGLGLGDASYFKGLGLQVATYESLKDYVDILRKLWAGESLSYDGPAGKYGKLALGFPYEGPAPKVWFGSFAKAKGAEVAARIMDGVLLPPMLTHDACAAAVKRIRETCDRIGRDPASIRIAQCVVTAPNLDDFETRSLAHGRTVTYLLTPFYGKTLIEVNGWDPDIVDKIRSHRMFHADGDDKTVDWKYHRVELMDPASLIPDSWMNDTCALGSVAHCVSILRGYRNAGADEIVTYGSTPGQNAKLVEAWWKDGK